MRVMSAALIGFSCLFVVVTGHATGAVAQTNSCLPPPNLIFSEVAQVLGTNSLLWSDLQQVEATDAAEGTTGSGQVIQDMLATIDRDGYQWDCASDQLLVDAATPTAIGGSAHPESGADPSTAPGSGATATTPTAPPASDNNNTGVTAPLGLASGPTGSGSNSHVPIYLLGVLVVLTGALIVYAVRRSMSRR